MGLSASVSAATLSYLRTNTLAVYRWGIRIDSARLPASVYSRCSSRDAVSRDGDGEEIVFRI